MSELNSLLNLIENVMSKGLVIIVVLVRHALELQICQMPQMTDFIIQLFFSKIFIIYLFIQQRMKLRAAFLLLLLGAIELADCAERQAKLDKKNPASIGIKDDDPRTHAKSSVGGQYIRKELNEGGQYLFQVVPQNLIENGAFDAKGTAPVGYSYKTRKCKDWDVVRAQIGSGKDYNTKWDWDVNVAELDVNNNTPYTLELKLSKGDYYVAFDWAPHQGYPLQTSQILISWNGQAYFKLLATYDSVFTQSFVFYSKGGKNNLTFTGEGTSDGVGASFTNVRVYPTENSSFFSNPAYQSTGFSFQESYEQRNLLDHNAGQNMSTLSKDEYQFIFEGNRKEYYLSFDYTVFSWGLRPITFFMIAFNYHLITRFQPYTDGTTHRMMLLLFGRVGVNSIKILADGLYFRNTGVVFANFQVHPVSLVKQTYEVVQQEAKPKEPSPSQTNLGGKSLFSVIPNNFIENGNFYQGVGIIARGKRLNRNEIRGWDVGYGEIGSGKAYNSNWDNGINVAELDVDTNTDYTLLFSVIPGNYYAAFDWAPRQGHQLSTSQLELTWNGKRVLAITPSYNAVFTQSFSFYSSDQQNNLTLTGSGPSDGFGATFTHVRVYRASDSEGYFGPSGFHNTFHQGYALANLVNPDLAFKINHSPLNKLLFKFSGTKTVYYASFDLVLLKQAPIPISTYRFYINNRKYITITPNLYTIQRQFVQLNGRKNSNTLKFLCSRNFKVAGVYFSNFKIHEPY